MTTKIVSKNSTFGFYLQNLLKNAPYAGEYSSSVRRIYVYQFRIGVIVAVALLSLQKNPLPDEDKIEKSYFVISRANNKVTFSMVTNQ